LAAIFFGLLGFLAAFASLGSAFALPATAAFLDGFWLACRGILPIDVGCRLVPMAVVVTGRLPFFLPDLMCAVANALLTIVCHGLVVSIRADFSVAPTRDYSKQSVAVQPSDVVSSAPA